jgi:hypothetical protein
LLPTKERERSAVKGATVVSVPLRGSTCRSCGTSSPYGAPLRRFRRWDPSASPGCHGYCPMALFRRRDGRFHPRLLSEPGGLLHTSPGTRFARPCARAPHPIHAQFASRTPLSEWGYVRHTDATPQRQVILKIISGYAPNLSWPGLVPAIPLREALCPPKRDARVKPAHDIGERDSRISRRHGSYDHGRNRALSERVRSTRFPVPSRAGSLICKFATESSKPSATRR